MINVQITGQLPQVQSDLTPAMERIAQRLLWSFGQQHDTSGFGSWLPTREGKPATLSGLRKTERTSFGGNFAEIIWKNTIHQRGGLMNQTERMRKFFWGKFYESSDEKWKWMALSRRPMVFSPRPMTATKEDIDYFKRELINRIFSIRETIQ